LKLSQGFTHLLGGESFQIQYPLVGNREGSNLWLFRLLPTTISNGIGELQGCTPLKEARSQGVINRKFSYRVIYTKTGETADNQATRVASG
jgi:hypothetical protein